MHGFLNPHRLSIKKIHIHGYRLTELYIYIFKKYTIESPTQRFNRFSRFRRAHGRGLNRREDMDTSCTKQSQHARVSDQTFLASELQMCGTICENGWEYRSWAYVVLPKSPAQKRHSCGGPENHLKLHGSLDSLESTLQTAFRLVHPFRLSSWYWPTDRHTDLHFSFYNLPSNGPQLSWAPAKSGSGDWRAVHDMLSQPTHVALKFCW